MRKNVPVLLFAVLLLTSIFTTGLAAAQAPPAAPAATSSSSIIKCDSPDNTLTRIYCVWLGGYNATDFDLSKEVIKWLFLLIVILLIYSSLAYAKFPESGGMQLLLAIVIGILATFLITTNELITALQSYTALGMALTIFLPILVLIFFTMVVSTKGSPFGILFQKIIWLIFSFYLFLKAGIVAYVKYTLGANVDAAGVTKIEALNKFTQFLIGKPEDVVKIAASADNTVLIINLAVALFVFFIGVVSNQLIVHWFAKEKLEAEKEAQGLLIKRSQALRKEESKAMENQ